MDRLVTQAGRALVRAMAGDDWHQASAAMAGLWSLAYPAAQAQGVQAELDELRQQVTRARRAGDAVSEQALEGYWQVKLQQLLSADSALASRLLYVLDHVLTPALLSPLAETSQDEQPAASDATAVRAAVIGQAAAGLTAVAAIIYGSGALTIALRLHFTHLSWETVLGQLPRDLILTTGFGEIILPAIIIGMLGAVLLNYLVNDGHGKLLSRIQLGLQRYLTAKPSVGHFAAWLLASAFFGVLEPLVSLYFYIRHRDTYFTPKVVIPPFDAMAAAAVLSAVAVGIVLILLPAPTSSGLNHGLSAPGHGGHGAGVAGRREVTARSGAVIQQVRNWLGQRTALRIISAAVRRVLVPPARQPARPSSLGTVAWMAWVGALVGFAVIPGIATFNAVTLFPDSTACSAEFNGGQLNGNLIATNGGWAYVVEYRRSEPGQDYIAAIPLSALRLQTVGRAGTCGTLTAPGPGGTALQLVYSPNPVGETSPDLDSAAAVSLTDAWAVGYANAGTATFRAVPLAEHFSGTRWSISATAPVLPGDDVRLFGVGFSSASDGWVVGADQNLSTGRGTSIIEHFNGLAWTRLPSPVGEPVSARLNSVAAVSATDAWAVGYAGNTPLIEHWDGSRWTIVTGAVSSGRLHCITALSARNIWAVGETANRAVIEHFDGTAWHQAAQPVSTNSSFLTSVSAAGPGDIWAVGGQSSIQSVLLEHFNGTTWTEVPAPTLPANLAYNGWLRGVTALGPADVWAVGSANSFSSQTLALHFNGTSWQVIPSANPPAANGVLESIAGTIPGQPLWATGPGTTIETVNG